MKPSCFCIFVLPGIAHESLMCHSYTKFELFSGRCGRAASLTIKLSTNYLKIDHRHFSSFLIFFKIDNFQSIKNLHITTKLQLFEFSLKLKTIPGYRKWNIRTAEYNLNRFFILPTDRYRFQGQIKKNRRSYPWVRS